MDTYILQIDTATEVCSVSVSANGNVVAEYAADEPNMHASALTVYIRKLLVDLQLDYTDLSAVAVSMGPGSYTGLRIGVSAAKGLCYALGIPLLGINTLEGMLEGYASKYGLQERVLYVPMLDARRMEVYMSVFDSNKGLVKGTEAVVVDIDTFSFSEGKIVLFGSGAEKLQSLFETNEHINVETSYRHSSAYLNRLAFEKWQNKEIEDLVYFEPFYLKEFVATVPKKQLGL